MQPSTPGNQPAAGGSGNPVLRYLGAHWAAVVLVVVTVVFVAENRERVSIDVLVVHVRAPLWLVLSVTAVVGILIGLLIARRRAKRAATPA
jgi:lipopolysaccharide assembly protein A